jgi:hypothetical protein
MQIYYCSFRLLIAIIEIINCQNKKDMEDDQERFIEEASAIVREQAYYMKQSLEKNNLREALKHSSNML